MQRQPPVLGCLVQPTVQDLFNTKESRLGTGGLADAASKSAQSPGTPRTRRQVPTSASLEHSLPRLANRIRHAAGRKNEGQADQGGALQRSMPSHSLQYPPVINEHSRTLAVPYTGSQDPGSPSGRIATNYAGTAAWLTARLPGNLGRTLRWLQSDDDVSLPALPKPAMDFDTLFADQVIVEGSQLDCDIHEAGLTHYAFYECLYRYNHYVAEGVPAEFIAEFNTMWTTNINNLLDLNSLTLDLPKAHVQRMVADMHNEVGQDYLHAIKKAIINHIFSDERARQRAGVYFVPGPPVVWGTVPFIGVEGTHGGPPAEWREALNESREHIACALATCSRSSLRLLELWHCEFDGLLLVDLPAPAASGLLELSAFCSAQTAHCASVRSRFDGVWLDKVKDVLESEADEDLGGRDSAPAFFEAISALLSTQIRSIVERSIEAYAGFFRRFAAETMSIPRQVLRLSDNDDREDAFLTVGLTAKEGDICFTTPLEQIADALLEIFRNFVVCLRGLERPDVKLGKNPCSDRPYLWDVSLDEHHVKVAEEFIVGVIRLNVANVEQALTLYDDYKHLLDEETRIRQLSENVTLTREDYMAQVDKLRATEAAIRENCPNEIRLQMISIDCAEINETLCQKAAEAVQILLQAILRNLLLKNDQLVKNFETVVNHMVKKPTSELELVDLEAHVEEFRSNGLRSLLADFAGIRAWLGFLFECEDRLCWAMLSSRHFQAIYDSARWVHTIDQIVSEREANLRREREALESKFKEQRNKFLEDLEGFNIVVDRFREYGNLRQVDDYLERIQVLRNQFARAHMEAEKMNSKEERLGWKPSSFEQLRHGEQALEPYYWLWTLAYNLDKSMKQWLRGALFQLDPAKVEGEVNSMLREAKKLQELFNELEQSTQTAVAVQLESQLSVMITSHLGLVHALCNKSLRQRHWEHITRIVGFPIEPDHVFTLSLIVERDVGKHLARLEAISDAATKEHEIELVLDSMEAEWQPVCLVVIPWRQTGTFVIADGCVTEMQTLVEDHLTKTQTMRDSEHVSPWAARVASWENWLASTAKILERWVRLQKTWTYLEPFYTSNDMIKQMPMEGQLFRKVDNVWRKLMRVASEQDSAMQVTKQHGLLDNLVDCCSKLDQVQKGLADYLETKRLAFPGHFFVSNGELLEILVDIKEPAKAQLLVRRCFETVDTDEQHIKSRETVATSNSQGDEVAGGRDAVTLVGDNGPGVSENDVEDLLRLEVEMQYLSEAFGVITSYFEAQGARLTDGRAIKEETERELTTILERLALQQPGLPSGGG